MEVVLEVLFTEKKSGCAAIGFNVETVTYKNIKFQVWDLGGQTSIRPYWRCYYPNTQAIIYVVDSSDTDRISMSAGEFHMILEEEELKEALILVYANKQVNTSSFQSGYSELSTSQMPMTIATCPIPIADGISFSLVQAMSRSNNPNAVVGAQAFVRADKAESIACLSLTLESICRIFPMLWMMQQLLRA